MMRALLGDAHADHLVPDITLAVGWRSSLLIAQHFYGPSNIQTVSVARWCGDRCIEADRSLAQRRPLTTPIGDSNRQWLARCRGKRRTIGPAHDHVTRSISFDRPAVLMHRTMVAATEPDQIIESRRPAVCPMP
jgi:hypothetical protein